MTGLNSQFIFKIVLNNRVVLSHDFSKLRSLESSILLRNIGEMVKRWKYARGFVGAISELRIMAWLKDKLLIFKIKKNLSPSLFIFIYLDKKMFRPKLVHLLTFFFNFYSYIHKYILLLLLLISLIFFCYVFISLVRIHLWTIICGNHMLTFITFFYYNF